MKKALRVVLNGRLELEYDRVVAACHRRKQGFCVEIEGCMRFHIEANFYGKSKEHFHVVGRRRCICSGRSPVVAEGLKNKTQMSIFRRADIVEWNCERDICPVVGA